MAGTRARSRILIDSSVPMPAVLFSGRKQTYPFPDMQVGDSFFLPVGDNEKKVAASKTAQGEVTAPTTVLTRRLRSAARYYKIKVRIEVRRENRVLGARTWRRA